MSKHMKTFEELILSEIEKIILSIVKRYPTLPIQAKSRAGAEISDFMEKQFVAAVKGNKFFSDAEGSPEGATKNPWDARVFINHDGVKEEIWIDFKAFKISSADSNPDIGTPDKVIKFILGGGFYLCFVHLFYQSEGEKVKFVKNDDMYSKVYFLKDISQTFRRNPKNQLQVNISAAHGYRSRSEFVSLLFAKIKASHLRQIEISNKKLKVIDALEKKVLAANIESEQKIIKIVGKKK